MALDAATLALTAAELKATLTDAKIAKLFEPTRDELVLTLRTRTDTYALLLSARSGSARVCLTEESFENPETPPSFCMLMRKHLTGGRLLDVHMEPGDRIVYFDFQCTNEMGDLVRNTLCAELMGRYSNLVLVQNGKIIDALKRVDFEDSDVRQLLPGLPYTTPPKPARPDFLAVSSASIVAAACERDLPVADALNKTVAGVGPVVCREAAWRAFDGEHLLANELTGEQKRALMAAISFRFCASSSSLASRCSPSKARQAASRQTTGPTPATVLFKASATGSSRSQAAATIDAALTCRKSGRAGLGGMV